jgi:hypothetical protein
MARGLVTLKQNSQTKSQRCQEGWIGKMIWMLFRTGKRRIKVLLELLHLNLCGPIKLSSIGGCRYFMLLIDDFSHYILVYFLKKKLEVAEPDDQ